MDLYHCSLALVIASLLQGLYGLGTKSQLSLLPRSLLATCTYNPSQVRATSQTENHYAFSLNLPGQHWAAVCLRPQIMAQIMEKIQLHCHDTWRENGLTRILEQTKATSEEELCRISFRVITDPREDSMFPDFMDDCILSSSIDTCGLAKEHYPWPSECSQAEVSPSEAVMDIISWLVTRISLPLNRQLIRDLWLHQAPADLRDGHTSNVEQLELAPENAKRPWTNEEERELRDLRENQHLSWRQTGERLERSPQSVHSRYYRLPEEDSEGYTPEEQVQPKAVADESRQRRSYTPEEEDRLKDLKENRNLSWRDITEEFAKEFPRRGLEGLRTHYSRYLRDKTQPYRWTAKEDRQLRDLKERQNLSWDEIAKKMPARLIGGIKTHYYKVLAAGKTEIYIPWTAEDDELLIRLKDKENLQWDQIADRMERTIPSVYAQYYRVKKERLSGPSTVGEDRR